MTPVDHIPDAAKHVGDVASVGVVLGTLFNILPGIASLLTVIWMLLRIYETILSIKIKHKSKSDG